MHLAATIDLPYPQEPDPGLDFLAQVMLHLPSTPLVTTGWRR
jgi:hypothetical protein